jgi:hypothetical protein
MYLVRYSCVKRDRIVAMAAGVSPHLWALEELVERTSAAMNQQIRIIEIDARKCATVIDFLRELRTAIRAPDWHGWGPDAFVDSMIWNEINELQPPYLIKVTGSDRALPEVAAYASLVAEVVRRGREERRDADGVDIDVSIVVEQAPN